MSDSCIHGPGVDHCGHPDCTGARGFNEHPATAVVAQELACGMGEPDINDRMMARLIVLRLIKKGFIEP
jgi:hypothetical protein